MALPDFLANVSAASRFIAPRAVSQPPEPQAVAETAEIADLWLRPQSVEGFDPADVGRFPNPNGEEGLPKAVWEFRQAAEGVDPVTGPTAEQARDGLRRFAEILHLTKTFRLNDELADVQLRVKDALWRVKRRFPERVVAFDFEVRDDSTDHPAVFVWAILPDGTDVTAAEFQSKRRELFDAAADEVVKAGIKDRIIYTGVRWRSEMTELIEAAD